MAFVAHRGGHQVHHPVALADKTMLVTHIVYIIHRLVGAFDTAVIKSAAAPYQVQLSHDIPVGCINQNMGIGPVGGYLPGRIAGIGNGRYRFGAELDGDLRES